MKGALLALVFIVTFSQVGNSGAQNVAVPSGPPRYTLAINASHYTWKAGSKVVIQVAITNKSNNSIALPAEIEDYGYLVDVTALDDGTAADTDRGRKWKRNSGTRQSTSGPAAMLGPGETMTGQLVISDLYDTSRPGKYSIQVRRGPVKSNAITVTIAP